MSFGCNSSVQILEDEEYDYREGRASDADSEDSNGKEMEKKGSFRQ